MVTMILGLSLAFAETEPQEEALGPGSEFSVGYFGGTLTGPWPEPGVHGTILARYDAFIQSSAEPGPRLGASLWGSTTAWPLQHAIEESVPTEDFGYVHTGIMALIRHDPQAPVSGIFGFGFSRLDLSDYHGGPMALPMLSFEAGVRHPVATQGLLDLQARAHWSTARSGIDPTALEEWWLVQLGLSLGWRAN